MRRSDFFRLVKALACIFILMLIVNFIILRIYFDVHLSDLALLLEGESLAEGGSPSEGDSPIEGDSSIKGDSPLNGDSPIEWDGSIEGDNPLNGDNPTGNNNSLSSLYNADDAMELVKKLSLKDKITLAYIVSRIGKDELNRFIDISGDGLTPDEVTALRQYAGERLEPSDLEALEDIFLRNRHLYSDTVR